jgi:hypothetical protein
VKPSNQLPLKISKTRKRLSDYRWAWLAVGISGIGFVAILTSCFRIVQIDWPTAAIFGSIPLVLRDGESVTSADASKQMTQHTSVIVLTDEAFFFGDMDAFSSSFRDIRKKFVIPHKQGSPQLGVVLQSMSKWRSPNPNEPVILIPAGNIPMPIVIQVMAGISHAKSFGPVVLGAGIL